MGSSVGLVSYGGSRSDFYLDFATQPATSEFLCFSSIQFSSVQFSSVQSLDRLGRREDLTGDSADILLQSLLQKAIVSSSDMDREVHCLMLSIQRFILPNTALPTLQGALKAEFGETVVACDMPEPYKFPSLASCQKRFLWTHKDVDLYFAPRPLGVITSLSERA